MKIKDGFRLRDLCNEYVVVGEGLEQINFNRMIVLNESAAYLFEQVQGRDFTAETLADLLFDKYEIDRETALRDSEIIASKWVESGIAE